MYISSREEYVISTCARFYEPHKDNTEMGLCSELLAKYSNPVEKT